MMQLLRRSLFKPLLVVAAVCFSGTVLGQSLSIVKQAESKYSIDANAPTADAYTLQASENMHLWIDVQEDVTTGSSHSLTNKGNFRYFRLKAGEPAPPIRVMLLGDSLGSDSQGWGPGFNSYLRPHVTFVNYAIANTSTKRFLRSAEKDNMLLIQPDYVLINHGYIDNANDNPDWTTLEEFEQNLKTIIEMVRGFNGVPILVTVQAPRIWDANGIVVGGQLARNQIIKRVSTEKNTFLIDFDQLTRDVYNTLGPTGSAFINFSPEDYMHFSPLGAKFIARYLANALPDELGPYLTGIFDPPAVP